jgi:transmembrane sensor
MTRAVLTFADVRGLSPAQAAARWMACDDLDQSPEREQHQLWREASPDNQAAWDAVQAMWGVFDDAEDNDLIAAMGRAARQAKPEPVRSFWPQAIAASIAVVAVSAALLIGMQGGWFKPAGKTREVASNSASIDPLRVIGGADYVTGRGQKTIVDLADGTRVTLDADSAVDVAFSDARRDVRLLRGRAFFDVAHDPAHPFAVRADSRVVTALGTQFDVRLTPGAVRVVLVQGSVSVAGGAGALVKLHPGEAFAAHGAEAGKVVPIDLDDALAWKQDVVEFENEPLSTAVTKLNRYTRAQIVIKDPKVAALRITGLFRTGDAVRFGRNVAQVLPVKLVARDADTYELVAAKR